MSGSWAEALAAISVPAVILVCLCITAVRLGLLVVNNPVSHYISELLESAALAMAIVFLIIRPFILQSFYIPSGSMRLTLLELDRLFVDKFSYRIHDPAFRDIVVFKAPPQADIRETEFIKRCIGVPGDVIEVRDGQVIRNGVRLNEPYIQQEPYRDRPSIPEYDMKIVDGVVYSTSPNGVMYINHDPVDPATEAQIRRAPAGPIPPGMYLMLGDNRNDSNDGHCWGLLPRNRVVGRAWFRFWPLSRIGLVH